MEKVNESAFNQLMNNSAAVSENKAEETRQQLTNPNLNAPEIIMLIQAQVNIRVSEKIITLSQLAQAQLALFNKKIHTMVEQHPTRVDEVIMDEIHESSLPLQPAPTSSKRNPMVRRTCCLPKRGKGAGKTTTPNTSKISGPEVEEEDFGWWKQEASKEIRSNAQKKGSVTFHTLID